MVDFRYAFERLDETDAKKKIVHLTMVEFDIFFALSPPSVVCKALAWSEFRVMGDRMKRVDITKGA